MIRVYGVEGCPELEFGNLYEVRCRGGNIFVGFFDRKFDDPQIPGVSDLVFSSRYPLSKDNAILISSLRILEISKISGLPND